MPDYQPAFDPFSEPVFPPLKRVGAGGVKQETGVKTILFFLTVVFLPLAPCLLPKVFAEEPHIRVAILQEAPDVRITVPVPCRLKELKSGKILGEWTEWRWKRVSAGKSGLNLGEIHVDSSEVLLQSLQETVININAKPYRGSLIFRRTSAGKVTVIVLLEMEQYLVGALASEAKADWPAEALKAHAVVSRTTVAHRIWISRNQPFDVTADIRTHVYHGVSAEREGTRQAVLATKGQVLSYKGELLSAAFHANCGGHTENAAELWELKSGVVPLQGVQDPYCRGLRHFSWRAEISFKEMAKALGEFTRTMGDPANCEILDRNGSGRVRKVRLIGTAGSIELSGRRFREILGSSRLRSLNFTVSSSAGSFLFSGFGWGHGVGLCQWGAYGMARQGKKMEEILSFYFPGAQRRELRGLPGFSR